MLEETKAKVNQVICDRLGAEMEQVTPEAHLTDTLGADSIDLIELVMAVEEELDIQLDIETDGSELTTVQSVYDMVDAHCVNNTL